MRELTLDFGAVSLRYELHLLLKETLSLPPWYGMNLDALHDCLTDPMEPTRLTLRHTAHLREALGNYGDTVLQVLRDSAAENPSLTIME